MHKKKRAKGQRLTLVKHPQPWEQNEAEGLQEVDGKGGQHYVWKHDKIFFKKKYQMLQTGRVVNKKICWFGNERIRDGLLRVREPTVVPTVSVSYIWSFFFTSLALTLWSQLGTEEFDSKMPTDIWRVRDKSLIPSQG